MEAGGKAAAKEKGRKEGGKKEGTPAAPSSRQTGATQTGAALATKKGMAQATKTAGLPRTPRTSTVTLTINEGFKTSYADVLATALQKVLLVDIGVETLTPTEVIRNEEINDRGNNYPAPRRQRQRKGVATGDASGLCAGRGRVRVAAPNRTAELRVGGIDISVAKEELRQALSSAA
jgi:hypothetical protein